MNHCLDWKIFIGIFKVKNVNNVEPQSYELPQRIYDSRIKTNNPYYRSTVFDPTKRSRLPNDPVDCLRQDNRFSK
jgi:hypothetical protein